MHLILFIVVVMIILSWIAVGLIACDIIDPHFHRWLKCQDDDWDGVAAYYCSKCGLIKQVTNSRTFVFRKFYREYSKSSGWGVMLGYDTVFAKSASSARKTNIPVDMYGDKKDFEFVGAIQPEHLTLSDDDLSHIYGVIR